MIIYETDDNLPKIRTSPEIRVFQILFKPRTTAEI